MSVRRVMRFNRYLMLANLTVLAVILAFLFFGSSTLLRHNGTLEGSRLILRGESGTPSIIMQGDDQNTLLTLNDHEGKVRLQLQGGDFPAVIMKNTSQEIVGTFFPLKDGGAGMGLGDGDGDMATFIRGGSAPTMSFFHKSNEPNIAMGISNNLPHFLLFPLAGKEGLLIHGNSPTSLLFIDEKGEIPVSLSRHGLYQGSNNPESENSVEEKEKIFSSSEDLKKALKEIDYVH